MKLKRYIVGDFEVEIPKGWRKLRANESLMRGDRFFATKSNEWLKTRYKGERVSEQEAELYIRKI